MEENNVLILALKSPEYKGEIYMLDSLSNPNPQLLAKRNNWPWTLCEHNGRLYDGGDYAKIYDTLENKSIANIQGRINTSCSHKGELYAGIAGKGNYENINSIFNVTNNKIVAERENWPTALCSHKGKLYDGGRYKEIFDTLDNKIIAKRKNWTDILKSNGNNLFDCYNLSNSIFDTLNDKLAFNIGQPYNQLEESMNFRGIKCFERTLFFGNSIEDLCVCNGKLFCIAQEHNLRKSSIVSLEDNKVLAEVKWPHIFKFLIKHNKKLIAGDGPNYCTIFDVENNKEIVIKGNSNNNQSGYEIMAMISIPKDIINH